MSQLRRREIIARFQPQTYMPTPEEIADKCAAIRQTWTDQERRRRAVGEAMIPQVPWMPPTIDSAVVRPAGAATHGDI